MTDVERLLVELREIVDEERELWSGKLVEALSRRRLVDFDLNRARGQLRLAIEYGTGADVEAAAEPLGIPWDSAQAALDALDQLESRAWLLRYAGATAGRDEFAERRPGEAIARARRRLRRLEVINAGADERLKFARAGLLDCSPPCQGYQGT